MDIIITIVVGFVVGLIARAILPGKQSMGFIMTTILGIVGALVAGLSMQALGFSGAVGWISSVIGAIVVLWLYGLVSKKR